MSPGDNAESVDSPQVRGRGPVIVVLAAAALLAVLDGTVVAAALGPLAEALGSSVVTVVWATVGYLLAAAAVLPTLAWSTSRFGGRNVFLAGLVLFVVGSALVSLSWSIGALIVFRVLQGAGGGLLEPASLMLVARLARPQDVGQVMGRLSMIINVAPVVGPIVGSALLATGHWQWIFVVNIPFGLAVLAGALVLVPRDRASTDESAPADVRGLGLLSCGYVGVLLAINRLAQPALAIAAGLIGVALLTGYVRYAFRTTRTPAFDLRLLRRGGFAAALGVMSCVGIVMYSLLTSLPIFAVQQHGLHGVGRGLLVCALGVGLIVSMTAGGRVSDATGPRVLVRAGASATAIGLAALAAFNDDLSLVGVLVVLVAIGLGFGWVAAPAFTSVYRALPVAEQPQGTTALFMTVQFAASLGVMLLGLLQRQVPQSWFTVLVAIAAATAAAAGLVGRWLPGRPSADELSYRSSP